ncbi:hypothetical protein HDU77_009330 [Chytriomyces hyalinus]|nr:hypothetical protein HDU77_009330 [Chytriomyces hyalinus]
MMRPIQQHVKQIPSLSRGFLTRNGPPKLVSPDEAVQVIKSNDRVFVHGVAATPVTLLTALEKRAHELKNVEFVHLHLEKPNPCSSEKYRESFFSNNLFIGANQRKNVAAGISSYVPVFLHEMPALMRKGFLRPDVALINVSPPDRHGFVSLGVEVATALPAVETATTVIAQINPNMPRTHGYSFVHMDSIDYICHVNDALPEVKAGPPNDVETRIGANIAELVSDGATLQMGIGAIPNAVLAGLKDHKNLGIHTEMFQEGVIPLINSGVITNLNKKFLPGKILTSFIMGSRTLYDYVDDNPSVAFYDASITNDPVIIARNPKVTAINSAVEIDLTGQVCADSVGHKMISGVGGQVDFERGAALSPGGLPIICLPSTAKDGSSRIVPNIREGGGVITTRNHVHYVVTEWGTAFLFGKNLQQRAKALIAIAHPDHRAELERQAFEFLGLQPQQSEQVVYEPPVPSVAESVFLPAETPDDVIKQTGDGPAYVIQHSGLMIGRQIEMMNVLVGYEQANKYAVTDHNGVNVGFICEEEVSFAGNILRQVLGTRRVFNAVVLDVHGNVVLKINRPFKWFLNSTITISDANDTIIGEVKQVWHPLRRKYDLFLKNKQFAIIEAGFLAWDFVIEGEHPGEVLAAVNRNFAGFAREIFTDTGVYAIHMDNIENKTRALSLDERAVILGCAITIDIDYFSRHSDHGSGMLPFLFMGALSS